MKKLFLIVSMLMGCSKTYEYDPQQYFSKEEIDLLMPNLVTYIYKLPAKASLATRFSPAYASYYKNSTSQFLFDSHYYSEKDGYHYYLLERPAGNDSKYKRTVGGRFKLKKGDFKPYSFEEIFNSPRLPDSVRIERGRFLFKELIKNGNINSQLAMKHYVEWPDATLIYDKNLNTWVVPNTKISAE